MAHELDQSERQPPLRCLEESATGQWPADWPCDVTLYLRAGSGRGAAREASQRLQHQPAGLSAAGGHLSRGELAALVQPAPGDLDKVVDAFVEAGIDHVHPVGLRAVHVRAPWGALRPLVSAQTRRYRTRDGVVAGRVGPIRLEHPDLDPVVAVFGLDNRRALSPYVIKSHVIKSHVIKSHVIKSHGNVALAAEWAATAGQPRSWFTAADLAEWYDFPPGTGAGSHVGVLAFSGQLGGTDQLVTGGYDKEALDVFFEHELGLSPLPSIAAQRIRGPGNWPGDGDSDFSDEVMLDLSVVGALAPGARITVYFSEPTEQGFVDALHHVAEQDDAPDVLLVCYGSPEDGGAGSSWTRAAMAQGDEALAAAALRGITVVCSCGDNGAAGAPLSTRVHTDFPASSAWVLACGGTTADRSGDPLSERETVWNDGTGASGGGVSAVVPRPSWQSTAAVPVPVDAWRAPDWQGRGVPDVAAVADPATGVAVVDALGDTVAAGGTSVSAPVWAALLARCREGGRLGLITPALYASRTGLHDVAVGDNGAYAAARDAWDPCTGWGVPDGRALRDALLADVSQAGPEEGSSAPGPA